MLLVIRGTQQCPKLSTSAGYAAVVATLDRRCRRGPTSELRGHVFQFDEIENPSSEYASFPNVSPKLKFDPTTVGGEFPV